MERGLWPQRQWWYERLVTRLKDKRILLGVSGGIAAYKSPEIVRRLKDAGADVHVIVTTAGAKFVSTLSLEVVSGHPVGQNLWATDAQSQIVHTALGKEVDLILLAPATANLIARVSHGFADDLLSTTIMACTTPVLLAPSMNTDMLNNPIVQRNLARLTEDPRYRILAPDAGSLACGVVGPGRLPDPSTIISAAAAALTEKTLAGRRITISAGPTREAIDPVRYLTNPSTGTMGFALAESFAARGAYVSLIAGPVALPTPYGVAERHDVTTAAEMKAAVVSAWEATDVLLMSAAVADYRPETARAQKIKKDDGPRSIPLTRTDDVLAWTRDAPGRTQRTVIGFAAETERLEAHAAGKIVSKGLDWIVANDVSQPGAGFGTGDNTGLLLGRDGSRLVLARQDKAAFAEQIVKHLEAAWGRSA